MNPSKEHHSTMLHFAMVEDGKKKSLPRENIVQMRQTHFDLPTITVSSDPKRARQKRERDQRCCTIGRLFGGTIVAFAVVYYKEISGFMNGMVPQTVLSLPRIKQDYSSIKGMHDLSSSTVKPRCFVSQGKEWRFFSCVVVSTTVCGSWPHFFTRMYPTNIM